MFGIYIFLVTSESFEQSCVNWIKLNKEFAVKDMIVLSKCTSSLTLTLFMRFID